jgi:hypothetical protein
VRWGRIAPQHGSMHLWGRHALHREHDRRTYSSAQSLQRVPLRSLLKGDACSCVYTQPLVCGGKSMKSPPGDTSGRVSAVQSLITVAFKRSFSKGFAGGCVCARLDAEKVQRHSIRNQVLEIVFPCDVFFDDFYFTFWGGGGDSPQAPEPRPKPPIPGR